MFHKIALLLNDSVFHLQLHMQWLFLRLLKLDLLKIIVWK